MSQSLVGAQVNLYAIDPEALATFYKALGMAETFRFPATGRVDQLELSIGSFTLGLSSREALRRLAGIEAGPCATGAEVVLWCTDVHRLFALALDAGAQAVAAPRTFHHRLCAAWLEDPEGNRLKLVARLATPEATGPGAAA